MNCSPLRKLGGSGGGAGNGAASGGVPEVGGAGGGGTTRTGGGGGALLGGEYCCPHAGRPSAPITMTAQNILSATVSINWQSRRIGPVTRLCSARSDTPIG